MTMHLMVTSCPSMLARTPRSDSGTVDAVGTKRTSYRRYSAGGNILRVSSASTSSPGFVLRISFLNAATRCSISTSCTSEVTDVATALCASDAGAGSRTSIAWLKSSW